MSDVHNKETRSFNMSQIKSKNTKPEILVRKYLHSQGFRFKLHDKNLPGRPDIVMPKYNTVIFVHGCFWHGHKNCKYFVIPKTKEQWWTNKIEANGLNDKKKANMLKKLGWNVIHIWECNLRPLKREKTFNSLKKKLIEIGSCEK